ncbi:hypothetical protein ALI22I_20020 [Saccharothrix sp. ALI-22-I]|nr:hypothetical protein ALI22I_20020 [Saccharothrix sp. ALI-22-I]
MSEPDLRWLITAGTPRRGGRRGQAIAEAAAMSGWFRLLYDLDLSDATTKLDRLVRIEPRPGTRPALCAWLDHRDGLNALLTGKLIDAVPPAAKAWAGNDASRLIAGIEPSGDARAGLVDQLCALAGALPANGIPLSVLASHTVRRTHGLDANTTLGRLGARLAAAIAGHPPPTDSAAVREAWAAVGVLVDPVSSQVSGWRLPIDPDHPAAAVSAAYQAAKEPAVLTLGVITSGGDRSLIAPPQPESTTLWVVEGISALTAIVACDAHAAVLCRGGTPSVAATKVISAAAASGWRVAVSSDFEPGGLRGAITALRHAGTAGFPWRLTATDYLTAPAEGERFPSDDVPATPWDPDLATAMRHRRERVSEENRLDVLLTDLHAQHG